MSQIPIIEGDTNRLIWRDGVWLSTDNESAAVKRWEGEGGALAHNGVVRTENSADLARAFAMATLGHPHAA